MKHSFIVKEPYLRRIDNKRASLYESFDKYGLDSEQTVKLSQELDQLINEYMERFGPIPFI